LSAEGYRNLFVSIQRSYSANHQAAIGLQDKMFLMRTNSLNTPTSTLTLMPIIHAILAKMLKCNRKYLSNHQNNKTNRFIQSKSKAVTQSWRFLHLKKLTRKSQITGGNHQWQYSESKKTKTSRLCRTITCGTNHSA